MVITICVGSACHLKGSQKVIETLQKLVAEQNLYEEVELKAGFCLGRCAEGVTIKADDRLICNVTPDNITEIFNELVAEQSD